jgi:hypothetical protein
MKILSFKQSSTQSLSSAVLVAAALALSPHAYAADKASVSGSFTGSIVKQEALPVSAQQGDVLLLDEAHGINRNTGWSDFMEGAQINNKGVAALLQGAGPQHGYLTFTQGEDQVDTKWSGSVTTVMSKDGQPQISFSGTWEQIKGTGKYQGIHGKGTYSGHYTSSKDYVVDWVGQTAIPMASR